MDALGLSDQNGFIKDMSSTTFTEWLNMFSCEPASNIGGIISDYSNYKGDPTVSSIINCEGGEGKSATELSDAAHGLFSNIRSLVSDP